jgi:hypothetical protein
MYAYAGGESQEWRLTASMNAIARRLPRELVASTVMLISPTTPASVSPEDRAEAQRKKAAAPPWMSALHGARRLRDGFEQNGSTHVARAIVKTQGVSYQAAQYLGKMLAAEAYSVFGNQLDEHTRTPLTVSANVAPITATRSLSHPVFEAAFLGAPAFHILIAKSEASRELAGLLTLHDLLNPAAPGAAASFGSRAEPRASTAQGGGAGPVEAAARARGVLTQQIHGGIYSQPYALDGCISVAALRGLTKKPRLALGLFR